jgi:uncharacterized protein (TIGR02145 family)
MTECIIRRTGIILFIIFLSFFCFSQKEFNNWYFGAYAGLTFNSGSPVFLPGNPYNSGGNKMETSVSDSNGTLLFFSGGIKVFDRSLAVMPNGNGLLGGESWGEGQFIMVVPFLNEKNKYYLFTTGFNIAWPNFPVVGIHYSVLDMQLHGGYGDIVAGCKNIPLYMGDSAVNQLTAIRHHNNKDAWVVAKRHGLKEAVYLAYLVTSAGIDTIPVVSQSIVDRAYWWSSSAGEHKKDDHLRISPDGKSLVCRDSLIEVCEFNSSTGQVIPKFTYITNDSGVMGGFEFSKDSRYLYASMSSIVDSAHFYYLVQYDMNNQDSMSFVQNRVIVGDSSGYCIQMAPDGKIYLNDWSSGIQKYLHVINYPSQPGLSCGYQKNVLYMPGQMWKNYYWSLCTFLQRYKAYVHHTGQCVGDSIYFTSDIWPPTDSIHWDFGDPFSGNSNFSNLANPVHLFSGPGTYTVELWVRHNDKRTDTTWVTIEFPNPQLGPDRTICTGESVTFDAGYCLGCSYLWVNLTTTDTLGTSRIITTGIPGLIKATVTNTYACTATDTVQLSLSLIPDVSNKPLAKTICSGESTNILLTSSVTNTMFEWSATVISGTVMGASADSGLIINQVLVNPGPNPGIVKYHITPYVGNCIGDTANFLVTVNPAFPVDISITASANPVCQGTSVTFTATPVNQGSSPVYQWKVNGIIAGTNNPVFTYTPVNGDQVYCVLTSSNTTCTTNNPATSNTIVMIVNPNLPVSLSITASVNPVCAGTSVTYTATPTNGGTSPVYQWKVNGVNVGTNSSIYTYVPVNNDVITCILTSNVFCPIGNPATSNPVTMTVNPLQAVSVSITASQNPICAGTSVTYTAIPVNGGTSPIYQWKVNGINAGTNNPVYSYTPVNNNVITCVLTSNVICPSGNPATSNPVTMIVNPMLPVGVTITASQNPVCASTSVTYMATPVNGGTPPVYQWKINGINVGTNNPVYSYIPLNGDLVSCILTSSEICTTGNPAMSTQIQMVVNNNLPANVSITGSPNPFCPGVTVSYTATPVNGGTSPGYQWKINGNNTGTNSPSYSYSPVPNDTVLCVMISNLSCVSGNPATSNKIVMVSSPVPVVTFTRCFDSVTTLNAKPIKLKGGIPLGGTYTGSGVNSTTSVFTPSFAGVGTKTLTYTYTNVALCSANKTTTITIQANPSFSCGNNLIDIRDGKAYPTLQIGSQCWMAANLNYGTMILSSSHQRDNCISEKYCYKDLTANCQLGTAAYQWDELMRYDDTPGLQGLCPPGWHVPTKAEWNTLFANWWNNAFAGAPLKYSGYSGFDALLSGVRHQNVQWDYRDFATFFWSSTPYSTYKAWSHGMNDYDPSVASYPALRSNAFSVRCLKD